MTSSLIISTGFSIGFSSTFGLSSAISSLTGPKGDDFYLTNFLESHLSWLVTITTDYQYISSSSSCFYASAAKGSSSSSSSGISSISSNCLSWFYLLILTTIETPQEEFCSICLYQFWITHSISYILGFCLINSSIPNLNLSHEFSFSSSSFLRQIVFNSLKSSSAQV